MEHFLNHYWQQWRKRIFFGLAGGIAVLIVLLLLYAHAFGPTDVYASQQQFLVRPGESTNDVVKDLTTQHIVRAGWALRIALLGAVHGRHIRPGGYEISKAMDTWTIATVLGARPYFAFITLTPGMRKEQIADVLTDALSWTPAQKDEWITKDTAESPSYTEGVYYPDTYLIPSDQAPAQVAARLRDRFADVFAPYAAQAQQQHVAWTQVLTMASLVEREAAKNDKALVAGILWNRLHDGMPLAVDATLQYIQGSESNWWPTPDPNEKYSSSPFNTYMHTGLPPHPIAEPSLASIQAVLEPQKTNCLFYLHDTDGTIHCSPTYSGHLANIRRYLR